MPLRTPRVKKRTALLRTLKPIFRSHRSRPISEVIAQINPILRGWVQYFAVGHSSRCFSYIRGNGITATPTQARRGKPRTRPRSRLRITAPVPDPTTRGAYRDSVCRERHGVGCWTKGVNYTSMSESDRGDRPFRRLLITMHGIRTFGLWHDRLESLVKSRDQDIEVQKIDYGLFSALAFVFPRGIELTSLRTVSAHIWSHMRFGAYPYQSVGLIGFIQLFWQAASLDRGFRGTRCWMTNTAVSSE
jgi:hypothetical protein